MSTTETGLGTPGATAGRVSFLDGQGEMPMLEVITPWSTAEIYLHGAHVTRFSPNGQPPLLFMSQCSRFAPDQPIRGGIPVIFPWFGQREGLPQHGFARLKAWDLKEFTPAPDGSVSIRLRLPDYPEGSGFPPFTADYIVTVKDSLMLQLVVTNNSPDEELAFEDCLHSYFEVGDAAAISITGLRGMSYLDKVADFAPKTQTEEAIRIGSEVDRIYLNTIGAVEIEDPRLRRKIRIEKQGSLSTVVWNPWITKAQQMPDFGNDEFNRMVCVESGNVASNRTRLPPGGRSVLAVKLSSLPLL
jgi:glucose-6-phosphate 1-epimerase